MPPCGETAIRLTKDWHALVKQLRLLGRVMAVTRNEYAVLQRQGTYSDLRLMGDRCRMQGEQIDLSLSLKRWRYGFAVREATVSGTRRSLQFFDCAGHAAHKAYLTDDSDLGAYYTLINTYSSADQGAIQDMAPDRQVRMEMPDAHVDVAGLRTHWERLIDARAFSALLNRFGVTRLQALRLAGSPRARQVATSSLRTVLEKISEIGLPIRIKVGNPGACQTYTGPIHNLRGIGKWYSVLDPDFNLHVREAAVHSAWIVRRPTGEGPITGIVTSFELFDASGEPIARVLGRPKPGIPEDLAWRQAVTNLAALL